MTTGSASPAWKCFVLGIAGGSGSGKTHLAARLAAALADRRVLILAEDDYYHDLGAAADFEPAIFNFDALEARDHVLMAEQLAALKQGDPVDAPQYDFVRHRRHAVRRPVEPADIIIVDGAQILCDAALRAQLDWAVYLDLADDERLTQRLRRDVAERGRTPASVMAQFNETVQPMHNRYVYPSRFHADEIVDPSGPAVESISARLTNRILASLDGEVAR